MRYLDLTEAAAGVDWAVPDFVRSIRATRMRFRVYSASASDSVNLLILHGERCWDSGEVVSSASMHPGMFTMVILGERPFLLVSPKRAGVGENCLLSISNASDLSCIY